jgi:enamine deaminase RidA (YjgF/YER057c/UK114 family)
MLQNRKINPWAWQDAFGFSQAIETSGHTRVLRISGQTSTNASGEAQHAGDMAAQLALALDNLEAVLKAADMALANVVRMTLYTPDVDGFLGAYGGAATRLAAAGVQPAMTLLGVARLFLPDLLIEIEAEAVA